MNKKWAYITTFLLSAGIIAGCGNAEKEPVKKETTSETDKADKKVELEESATAKQVTAYEEMKAELGKAEEGEKVDWEKVSSLYTKDLQSSITEADGQFDQAITAAIEAGKNEELDANVARQLIDKTTQSYFYQKQKGLHKEAGAALDANDKEKAEDLFAELKYLSEKVFVPTAEKRDSYYKLEGESSIVENINAGLASQEEALKSGKTDDFKVFAQLTDKSIYRSYYLAANSYAEKIAAGVKEGKDKKELMEEQAEAWGFLQAISGSLSGGDETAAAELNKLFTINETDPSAIDPEQVNGLFTKAFKGKIAGYLEKAPAALEEGKVTDARESALEGIVFLKAIELELKKQLGDDKAAKALETGQKWFEAISNENKEETKKLGEELKAVLASLS